MKSKNMKFKGNTFVFLSLFLLILIAYSNTFYASWHFDDYANIVENSSLHLKNLKPTSLAKTFFSKNWQEGGQFYRPLPCLTFALNWFFGRDNVFGYHLINILIHLLTSIFLFLSIKTILITPRLDGKYAKNGYHIAFLATAIWAIHPIQIEAVTYIVQRMASMAAMFYVMAIFLYLRGRLACNSQLRIVYFSACFLSFIAALLSKENTILFPLSIILIEVIFFDLKKVLKLSYCYSIFFVFLIFLVGNFVYLRGDLFSILHASPSRYFSPWQRLLTEHRVLLFYLSQIIYPIPSRFSIEHDFALSTGFLSPWTTLPSIGIILFLMLIGIYFYRRKPLLSFAILFYLINHIVESTVLNLDLLYEHRNYLPTLFLFVPIVDGFFSLLERYKKNRAMKGILISFIFLFLSGLGFSTYVRNLDWATEKTLWVDAMNKAPMSGRALHNVAFSIYQEDHNDSNALLLYNKALTLKRHSKNYNAITLMNMATILSKNGEFEKAIIYLERALAINPNNVQCRAAMATNLMKLGEYKKAIRNINILIGRQPTNASLFLLKGFALLRSSNYQQSISVFKNVLLLSPSSTKAMTYLGLGYIRIGEFGKAEKILNLSHNMSPRKPAAILCLIELNLLKGNLKKARKYVDKITEIYSIKGIEFLSKQLSRDKMTIPVSKKIVFKAILSRIHEEIEKLNIS